MKTQPFYPPLALIALLAVLLACSGCEHAPSIEVMGSFFPSWMFCMTVGVVLILPVRRLFLRLGWDPDARSEAVVYPSLLVTFASLLWLLLFR
jgi:hypothetical protein